MARPTPHPAGPPTAAGPLSGADWERVFRETQVPLFIEDLSSVRPLLQQAIAAAGRHRLRDWLNAHPDLVGRVIGALRIVDANEAAVKLNAARSRHELLVSLDKLVLPETLEAFKDLICLIADGAPTYEGACRYRALDGREYQTLNRAWIPAADDSCQLLVIATVDITDLQVAKQALADSEDRYRQLIETAHDVILRHDLSGRVTFVNEAGVKLLGRPREKFIGLNMAELLTPVGLVEALRRKSAQEAGEAGAFLYETEYLRRDGQAIPVEVNSSLLPGPLYGAEGPQVLVVARDISRRRRRHDEQLAAEARQRDGQKLESLGALAHGVAHDFNNLLATILGHAELLRELAPAGEQQEYLAAITGAAEQAAAICRQMQAYAGGGQESSQARAHDLGQIVTDMRQLLRVAVSGSSHLHCEVGANLPPVMIEPAPIRQVLVNLVTNAGEALAATGGEIMVRVGAADLRAGELPVMTAGEVLQPGPHVYCEVSDSGAGMEPGTVQRMFEPFFTTRAVGRGLGLSAALGIVRAHAGALRVTSAPGAGTTVTMWLPSVAGRGSTAAGRVVEATAAVAEQDVRGRTVLIVDDDARIRTMTESMLRRIGCRVLSAADGYDAVKVFGQRHAEIDVVMVDYIMPGLDGFAACRRLRVIKPEVSLLVTSGHEEEQVRAKAGGLGRCGFVAKPFTLKELRQALVRSICA